MSGGTPIQTNIISDIFYNLKVQIFARLAPLNNLYVNNLSLQISNFYKLDSSVASNHRYSSYRHIHVLELERNFKDRQYRQYFDLRAAREHTEERKQCSISDISTQITNKYIIMSCKSRGTVFKFQQNTKIQT
jgi:hypothetical protein